MNPKSILIIDHDEVSREVLRQMFEKEYRILIAKDGKDGLTMLATNMQNIAAIIMNLVMVGMNGYQFLQLLHAKKISEKIPVILVTSQKSTQIELACYSLGVATIISKPFAAQAVHLQVSRTIEANQKAEALADTVESVKAELSDQQKRLDLYYDRLLESISNMIEFRNRETGNHVLRIKGLTKILADTYLFRYPDRGLTPEKINVIVRASALHDIGKIVIPENILLKPGRLTESERQVIKSHTTKGCEILSFLKDVQDVEQNTITYDICRYHHERYDGNGYPDGLAGDDIPLAAQLVSVADVYDALVSERVYKKAYDKYTAYRMITGGECGVFSPEMLETFEAAREEIEEFSDCT